MSDHTTTQTTRDQFVTDMVQRMATLARTLSDWVTSEPHTLSEVEQLVIRTIKDLGATLIAGLCQLTVPSYPPPTLPCDCGALALFQRSRPATVKTVLDTISITRPYYLCPACHHGFSPLDQQLAFCAGGISAGLEELLALLGATEDSFAQAASVLEKLTLVSVCPNSVRDATERLGQCLHAHEQHLVQTAQATSTPPPLRQPPITRMYISMDGILVHLHDDGWKEVKLGTVYTTSTHVPRKRPEKLELRAVAHSYVTDLADAATFGSRLWAEAAQRGVLTATEVVVVGDGAHWIWNLADEYFPDAVQIVDWYHASEYVWTAAHAIYGQGSDLAKRWAAEQLERLWEGQVADVIATLQEHLSAGAVVQETLTYYSNQQQRMRYAEYRARGMQIGSGTIESGCKQVIGARLKLAGMIWERSGAQAVATVRTWLRSGRWEEAMRLRPPLRRRYVRREEGASAGRGDGGVVSECEQELRTAPAPAVVGTTLTQRRSRAEVPSSAPAAERAEQRPPARPAADHPWRRAWSRRRQCQQVEEQGSEGALSLSA